MKENAESIVQPGNADFLKFMHEVRTSQPGSSKLTKTDERFAIMAELDGWRDFKELATKRIDTLMSMRDYESAGRDLSELGLRFLVADMVAGEIEHLIRRVDQARNLYEEEQEDNTTRQKSVEKTG